MKQRATMREWKKSAKDKILWKKEKKREMSQIRAGIRKKKRSRTKDRTDERMWIGE